LSKSKYELALITGKIMIFQSEILTLLYIEKSWTGLKGQIFSPIRDFDPDAESDLYLK